MLKISSFVYFFVICSTTAHEQRWCLTNQSSVEWDGNSERAVDGNTDGEYGHNSCSHTNIHSEPWWFVDLCKQVTIYGVVLSNRNNFQSRLTNIDVAVTNTDPPQNFLTSDLAVRREAQFNGTEKLRFKFPKKGRYLVIKLRKEDYLTLCEVQWVTNKDELTEDFSDGDGFAYQSSIGWDGNPERAIDGNKDAEYFNNSCSHTELDDHPWWYVDFGTQVTVYGVLLSNRNSFQSRLSKIDVVVTNKNPPQNFSATDVAVRREARFDGTLRLKFKLPKKGQYLVIKLRKRDYLTLCEVQWVTNKGELTEDFSEGDGFVHQSSIGWDGIPERAVDGNTDGEYAHNSCSHTELNDEPWWYVDFGQQETLYGVVLSNRNSFEARLSMIDVAVTNTDPPQNFPTSDVAVRRDATFPGTIKLQFIVAKKGRYLVIKLRKQDYLTLCEVQWVTNKDELTEDFLIGHTVP